MLTKGVYAALLSMVVLLITGANAASADASGIAGVYAFWRGEKIARADFDSMRGLMLDGCFFPAVEVAYNPETGGWSHSATNLAGLADEDAIGLDFYIVASVKLWDEGWHGSPDLFTLSFITADICRAAIDKIEDAGGRIAGMALEITDFNPDFAALAQFTKWLRNSAAFQYMDLRYGIVVNPGLTEADGFATLAAPADYFVLDLTAMDPAGDPPRLIEEDWAVRSVRRLDTFGKPVIAALPMYERVLRYDLNRRMMDADVPVSFDILLENADSAGTDAAANPTATYTEQTEIGGYRIPAGTQFTHLKASPGRLAGVMKTLREKGIQNLSAVALDGLPYEPSDQAYSPSMYVSSLKGSALSPAAGVPDMVAHREEFERAQIKATGRVFWIIALALAIAACLAGLTVLRKRNLEYDEESGRFVRRGGDKK